jgi:hypothetical protein
LPPVFHVRLSSNFTKSARFVCAKGQGAQKAKNFLGFL